MVSVLAAIFRTALRLNYQKRLFVDDGFLLLAVASATACMGLYLSITDDLYMIEAIMFQGQLPTNLSFSDIEDTVNKAHILETIALELSWTSIFAVKFSFLFFFKTLVNRIRPMTILWQFVVAATTVAWVVGCLCAIMECPYFGTNEKMCMRMKLP